MPVIKYPFAKDESGNVIHAYLALSRVDYYCLGCNSVMRRRQGTMRVHFKHKVDLSNCSAESALHLGFKELLFERLQKSLLSGVEMIQWDCSICSATHQNNLIRKTKSVRKEMSLGLCRPDIILLDDNEKPIIAIEVVVTHEPEESTLQYYKDNKIALIKFVISEESDMNLLENEVLHPHYVGVCSNPKCKKCGKNTSEKKLWIISGSCWHCKHPMKIATIFITKKKYYTPDEFTKDDIRIANSYGANIQFRYSKTVSDKYNAHTCTRCNNITGQFFLFKEYISKAVYGRVPYVVHDIGYSCLEC